VIGLSFNGSLRLHLVLQEGLQDAEVSSLALLTLAAMVKVLTFILPLACLVTLELPLHSPAAALTRPA
jgi:hypothetical protein